MNSFARFNAASKRYDVFIYEDIGEGWFGGLGAKAFSEWMADAKKQKAAALDIYINSYGGSVFDGIAIYNQIKRFDGEKVVHIDGIAASIASVIAMAGDEIRISANGTMMIHAPWGMAIGTADDMRKSADSLDLLDDTILDTYVARTKAKRDDVSAWMEAETWMNADDCIKRGFADKKDDSAMAAAAATTKLLDKFKNVPQHLHKAAAGSIDANHMVARMQMRAASLNRGREPVRA
jgi:ATP-dependent Clp protease protease subunit